MGQRSASPLQVVVFVTLEWPTNNAGIEANSLVMVMVEVRGRGSEPVRAALSNSAKNANLFQRNFADVTFEGPLHEKPQEIYLRGTASIQASPGAAPNFRNSASVPSRDRGIRRSLNFGPHPACQLGAYLPVRDTHREPHPARASYPNSLHPVACSSHHWRSLQTHKWSRTATGSRAGHSTCLAYEAGTKMAGPANDGTCSL